MANKNYDVIMSSYSTVVNKHSNRETSTSTKQFRVKFKMLHIHKFSIILAVVYVLLGRAVTQIRWGGSRNIPFMRHKFLVLTVKKWLKSVYIYGSYRKIKTGVSLFLDHSVVVVVFTSWMYCDRESDCHVRRYYLEYQFGSFILLFVIFYCIYVIYMWSGLVFEPYVETDQSP